MYITFNMNFKEIASVMTFSE